MGCQVNMSDVKAIATSFLVVCGPQAGKHALNAARGVEGVCLLRGGFNFHCFSTCTVFIARKLPSA